MKYIFQSLLMISDAILVFISFYLAQFIIHGNIAIFSYYYIIAYLIILLTCFTINILFSLYSSLWRYTSLIELLKIISSVLLSSFILFLIFNNSEFFNRIQLLMLPLLLISFSIDRFGYRVLRYVKNIKRYKSSKNNRILMIGAGDGACLMMEHIQYNPQIGNIVAIIDDNPLKIHSKLRGVNIVGGRDKIIDTVKKLKIDTIIIAIPSLEKNNLLEILNICKKTNCVIQKMPDFAEIISGYSEEKLQDITPEDLLGREKVELDSAQIGGCLFNKVVFVSGGGGSIGSEICSQVAAYSPKKLIVFEKDENSSYMLMLKLKRLYKNLDIRIEIGCIRDKDRLQNVFSYYKPDIVFHAAAHKHVPLMEACPKEAVKNNVFGTLNLAQASCDNNVDRFVLISTDKAVNPTNIMGATKRIAELIVQAYNCKGKTDFIAVRFGNVLGSNGSVIPILKEQIKAGGPVTITHPDITRYFMTISEAASLVLQAAAIAKGGELFILDMGKPVKIDDLAKNLISAAGYKVGVDIEIKYTGLRPGEKLYEELMTEKEQVVNTCNKHIFVLKPQTVNLNVINKYIMDLRSSIKYDNNEIYRAISKILPEFNSDKIGFCIEDVVHVGKSA